jgi:hypothetical protein
MAGFFENFSNSSCFRFFIRQRTSLWKIPMTHLVVDKQVLKVLRALYDN